MRLHFFPCSLSEERKHACVKKKNKLTKKVCDARLVKNITFVAVDNFEVNLTISGDSGNPPTCLHTWMPSPQLTSKVST